jgi:hypothetical protein
MLVDFGFSGSVVGSFCSQKLSKINGFFEKISVFLRIFGTQVFLEQSGMMTE